MDKANGYHNWLFVSCKGDLVAIARQLVRDCMDQNPETFALLEASGLSSDKPLEIEDFKKASQFLIDLVKKEVQS